MNDLKLRTKLVLCFIVIMSVNAGVGVLNISTIMHLGALVNLTYDKALMSGTFAQTTKYDFAKLDAEVGAALLAPSKALFESHVAEVSNFGETLGEDLDVVKERALSERSGKLVVEAKSQLDEIQEFKEKILSDKRARLAKGDVKPSFDLWNQWNSDNTHEKIESTLELLSDDAAEEGYRFRLESEKRNERNLALTVWILSGVLVFSLLISLLLAFSLLQPLKILIDACKKITDGDYSIRSNISRRDEFGSLSRVFNLMLERIEQRDADIDSLLSALPFGVFYFGRAGEISKEHSAATEVLFEKFEAQTNIEGFMQTFGGANESQVREVREIVVNEKIPFDAATGLLPQSLTLSKASRDQNVKLSYRMQRATDGKIDRVIVIAEDVTARVVAQRQTELAEERVKRISKASKDLESFREFQPDALKLFDQVLSSLAPKRADRLESVKRDLHSLKGLLGVNQFLRLGRLVHEVETEIVSFANDSADLSQLISKMTAIRSECEAQMRDISDVLGLLQDEFLRRVDARKIRAIEEAAVLDGRVDIVDMIAGLERFPLAKVFGKYERYCQSVCETLGDRWVELSFTEDSHEISYAEAQHLDASLIHILRNCIDHGIEPADERMAAGKSDSGSVVVRAVRDVEGLRIEIKDDGRGIDAERLAQKAVEKGIWSAEKASQASFEEKVALIFASSFSTRDEASEISGRGVGMDAVQTYLESLGGRIEVQTTPGQGSSFTLFVPAKLAHDKSGTVKSFAA